MDDHQDNRYRLHNESNSDDKNGLTLEPTENRIENEIESIFNDLLCPLSNDYKCNIFQCSVEIQ